MPEMIDMTGKELATDATHPVTEYCPESHAHHWYAIYTSPRHEKRVREHLMCRNVECFLPLYRTVHRWKNGCKPVVELPLFPGYLFVKISQQLRVGVLEIPGVLSFVGTRTDPGQLSDFEIETLRSGLHLRKFAPYRDVAIGEKVRIKTGPLNGLVGVLVRNTNGLRVVLTLDMINQSVAVELDATDVEPIESLRPAMAFGQLAKLRN